MKDWIWTWKNSFLAWRFRKCLILDKTANFGGNNFTIQEAVSGLNLQRLLSIVRPRIVNCRLGGCSTSLPFCLSMEIGVHFKVKCCLFRLVVISINLVSLGWRDRGLNSDQSNRLSALSCMVSHLLKPNWKPSSSHSIPILISVPSFCYNQCVCVRVLSLIHIWRCRRWP